MRSKPVSMLPNVGSAHPLSGVRIAGRDFFWPLAIIGGLTLLILTVGTHFAVQAFNRSSEIREQILAVNGIDQRIDEVAHMVVPQVDWDEAVAKLDVAFDPKWAADNIGKFLYQTDGFDRSFVLDASDRPISAAEQGSAAPLASYNGFAPLVGSVIAKVRGLELARPPFPAVPSGTMVSHPIQASVLKTVGGRIAILTATLVQPDFGRALPRGARSPIVITEMIVDPAFLELFSRRFLLEHLHVRMPGEHHVAGESEIATRDDQGRLLGYLAWRPLNPGYLMLRNFLPPVSFVGAALILVALFQLRRVQNVAAELIRREAHSRAVAFHDPLTRMPNEAFFREAIAARYGDSEDAVPASIVHLVDVRNLAPTCASLSDDGADELVDELALRLCELCPDDGVLARISAEQFGFLLRWSSHKETARFVARISEAVAKPIAVDDISVRLGCSIGSAQLASGKDARDILRAATRNLYRTIEMARVM